MRLIVHLHFLPARKNLVPSMLFVPLGQGRGHMHLFDDVAPAHPSVISAERNLPFLRSVRDNALLRPPEVIVKQILEPHPRNKQEVPPVLPPLHHIIDSPVRTNLPIVLPRSVKVLIKLPQQIHQLEMRRRLIRIVVLHQTKRHPKHRKKLPPSRVINLSNILSQLVASQKRSNGHSLLSLLINHHRHPSPTIRVTTTT